MIPFTSPFLFLLSSLELRNFLWWTFGVYLQESILKCRDRVLADVFYNEQEKRWEMPPQTLKYAVDKELLESVQIRHDRGAMCYKLKGDDRTFFADLQVIFLNSIYEIRQHEPFLGNFDFIFRYLKILPTYLKCPFNPMYKRQQETFFGKSEGLICMNFYEKRKN